MRKSRIFKPNNNMLLIQIWPQDHAEEDAEESVHPRRAQPRPQPPQREPHLLRRGLRPQEAVQRQRPRRRHPRRAQHGGQGGYAPLPTRHGYSDIPAVRHPFIQRYMYMFTEKEDLVGGLVVVDSSPIHPTTRGGIKVMRRLLDAMLSVDFSQIQVYSIKSLVFPVIRN